MGKHVTYVPDCPECGQEAQQAATSSRGLVMSRYWLCRNCGWKSRPADTWADFEALTDELTEALCKADDRETMELPVDKDGKTIRVGDMLIDYRTPRPVVAIGDGTVLLGGYEWNGDQMYREALPCNYRHAGSDGA